MNDTPTSAAALRGHGSEAPPTRKGWLARAAEAGEIAERGAPEADRVGRLSGETMSALHERGLFRLLLPRAMNGHEVELPDYLHVIEALASRDASTAWCVGQGNCCAMVAAYVDRDVADRIWTHDPRAVLAWGPGSAEAVARDGGYRVTARSSFVSGGHHATWLGILGAGVRDADGGLRPGRDGTPETRTLLFPAAGTDLIVNWDVLGLRGTGSDGFEVTDLFIPEACSVVRATMSENRRPHGGGTLYGFPQMPVHAAGFAATAIGTARGFVDAFLDMAQNKVPRLHSAPLRDSAVVQDDVGQAEARLSAVRAWLFSEAGRAWEIVAETGSLPVANRMRIRLASTHAIREAKAAVDGLFDAAGTSSVFASGPFERRFRDIHMIAQQIQGRKAHYGTVGAWMLGHDPDMNVI
ncbi:MAG: acyl-CoA dehydrogenase family protein [Rhodospirillaceae bacterium]